MFCFGISWVKYLGYLVVYSSFEYGLWLKWACLISRLVYSRSERLRFGFAGWRYAHLWHFGPNVHYLGLSFGLSERVLEVFGRFKFKLNLRNWLQLIGLSLVVPHLQNMVLVLWYTRRDLKTMVIMFINTRQSNTDWSPIDCVLACMYLLTGGWRFLSTVFLCISFGICKKNTGSFAVCGTLLTSELNWFCVR
jgi:hypothetical protein